MVVLAQQAAHINLEVPVPPFVMVTFAQQLLREQHTQRNVFLDIIPVESQVVLATQQPTVRFQAEWFVG